MEGTTEGKCASEPKMDEKPLGKGEKPIPGPNADGISNLKRLLARWVGVPILVVVLGWGNQFLADGSTVVHWMGRTGLYIYAVQKLLLAIGVPLLAFWLWRRGCKERARTGRDINGWDVAVALWGVMLGMLLPIYAGEDFIDTVRDLASPPVVREVKYMGIRRDHDSRLEYAYAAFRDGDKVFWIDYPSHSESLKGFGALLYLNRGGDVILTYYPTTKIVSGIQYVQPAPAKWNWNSVRNTAERPTILERPDPEYPAFEKENGIEGTVSVALRIDFDGSVGAASVDTSSGSEALDEAALESVRKWKCTAPKTPKGEPAVWIGRTKVTFEQP